MERGRPLDGRRAGRWDRRTTEGKPGRLHTGELIEHVELTVTVAGPLDTSIEDGEKRNAVSAGSPTSVGLATTSKNGVGMMAARAAPEYVVLLRA